MFVNNCGNSIELNNLFANQTVFLICGGPSLLTHSLELLQQRGITTLAVNNSGTVFRPHLWACVDDPGNFSEAIWRDPAIQKFVPQELFDSAIFTRDGKGNLVQSDAIVRQMPNVVGYPRNEQFNAGTYLTENTVNWGMSGKLTDAYGQRGSRSVMLAAIRILYELGFRRINLLGCDFKMELGKENYAFAQDRSASSVKGNNCSYQILNVRFQHLQPYFLKAGLHIRNCTPNSGLSVFPYLDFQQAIREALSAFPQEIRTEGMYDRLQRERDARKLTQQHIPTEATTKSTNGLQNIEFTTVVGVDTKHLRELKLVWPTWKHLRQEILRQPMLLICDGDRSENDWKRLLAFIDHPNKEIVLWNMPKVDQREKMLTGLVVCSARYVRTPWYLKLDTDAAAVLSGNWCDPAWFEPDLQGRLPVFVASPWSVTRPAALLSVLDDWGDQNKLLKDHARLNLAPDLKQDRVKHSRITSWCFFGNTAWTKRVVENLDERMPVPSQDTFLWYCAARGQEHFRRIKMSELWAHTCHYKKLKNICDKVMTTPRTGLIHHVAKVTSETHLRGVTFLLTGIAHAVRLAVCLRSLRRHYEGPVTICTTRPESHQLVQRMQHDSRLRIDHQQISEVARQKHSSFLTKVSMANETPYQSTVFLDADTLVTGNLGELFQGAEESGFVATQFSNWKTSGALMRKRILPWSGVMQTWLPEAEYNQNLEDVLCGLPAINSGIFAYKKDTPLLKAWWKVVDAGWNRFLPDEIALQLVLPKFPHRILDNRFNRSPKYGPYGSQTHVWHFHGNKHLGSERAETSWLPEFQNCWRENWGYIQEWFPADDKILRKKPLATLLCEQVRTI